MELVYFKITLQMNVVYWVCHITNYDAFFQSLCVQDIEGDPMNNQVMCDREQWRLWLPARSQADAAPNCFRKP